MRNLGLNRLYCLSNRAYRFSKRVTRFYQKGYSFLLKGLSFFINLIILPLPSPARTTFY